MKLALLSCSQSKERGSVLVEFALSSLVWVPLLLGIAAVGTELIREIQVTQVCRDAAHMHAYGVDFSQTSNQTLILQTATGLGLSSSGGNGLILLSTIQMISDADCIAGGLAANSQNCPNLGYAVFAQQIPIGNTSYRSRGAFNPSAGSPPTDGNGTVSQRAMLSSPSDRATNIGAPDSLLPLQSGQKAYVGETFVSNADLAWTGMAADIILSRSIF
jgi:hypothetical protein